MLICLGFIWEGHGALTKLPQQAGQRESPNFPMSAKPPVPLPSLPPLGRFTSRPTPPGLSGSTWRLKGAKGNGSKLALLRSFSEFRFGLASLFGCVGRVQQLGRRAFFFGQSTRSEVSGTCRKLKPKILLGRVVRAPSSEPIHITNRACLFWLDHPKMWLPFWFPQTPTKEGYPENKLTLN